MCTVGYGDIGPTNYPEMLCVVVMIIIGCMTFGYIMNTIGNIIS